jgi:hypothetical protein
VGDPALSAQSVAVGQVRVTSRLFNVSARTALTGLIACSIVVRVGFAWRTDAPWILPDELLYSQLARSIASSGQFTVRGEHFSAFTYGPLYPLLIAPAYALFHDLREAYFAAKVINCALFSLAGLPAYSLARKFVNSNAALVFAGMALAVPSGIYTTTLMTESAAYPAFLLAVLAMVKVVQEASWRAFAFAFGAIALAACVRGQMIILVPALITSMILMRLLNRRWHLEPSSRHRLVPLAVVPLGAIGLAMLGTQFGRHGTSLLGRNFDAFRPLAIPRWFIYHLAEADLYTGIVPLTVFLLLAGSALLGRARDAQPLVIVTVAISSCMFALVATFATQPKPLPVVFDRYTFYVAPLFFLALVIFVDRRLTWSHRRALPVIALSAALPLLLPYTSLLRGPVWGASSASVGLAPWGIITLGRSVEAAMVLLIALIALIGVVLFTSLNRNASTLIRVTAAWLAFVGVFAYAGALGASRDVERLSMPKNPTWIDDTVGATADVAAIWPGARRARVSNGYALLQSQFFNRSVGRVFALREPIPNDWREVPVTVRDGEILHAGGAPVHARYVLTDVSYPVEGTVLATDSHTGLALYATGGHDVKLLQLGEEDGGGSRRGNAHSRGYRPAALSRRERQRSPSTASDASAR